MSEGGCPCGAVRYVLGTALMAGHCCHCLEGAKAFEVFYRSSDGIWSNDGWARWRSLKGG